ncbi:MAG: terpene cyclase/mutase family protein [Thermoguttaceae bacterium]|nr:terpene cyclase/mutase family protein [Thermoguttaceae bacterium]
MAEMPSANKPEKQPTADPKLEKPSGGAASGSQGTAGAGKPAGASSTSSGSVAKVQGAKPATERPTPAKSKPAAGGPQYAGTPVTRAAAPQAAKAAPAGTEAQPMEEEPAARGFGSWFLLLPSWLISMVFHMVLVLILAIWVIPEPDRSGISRIIVPPPTKVEELEELREEPLEQIDVQSPVDMVVIAPDPTQVPELPKSDDLEAAAVKVDLENFGLVQAPRSDLLARVGTFYGSGLDGRGKGKGQLLRAGGGNEQSELAVAKALKWLAEHQMPDGGWNFNHAMAPSCQGKCRNPGSDVEARNAATGLALLPFLGAGQTHKQGSYQKTVARGLAFLVSRMQRSPQGGSLYEGGRGVMYSHGICAIALCEAYAMTKDRYLYEPAQAAINFIVYAQDPVGGGWRYQPRQRGDTSVVGWQIMALKSAHLAYLQVPPITVRKATQFLDSVQSNSGANYGYTDPGAGPATTAIGLLCRMMLGWKKETPALEMGVKWLSNQGPSINPGGGTANMYYNYYATQVLRHWEGELWEKWNLRMRDSLIQTQAKQGHEEGSWFFTGEHGTEVAGRLYCTAMATMILEVYYRHMPIYRTQAVEAQFPE